MHKEPARMKTLLSRFHILSSEAILGSLVAILSVLAAVSGYQGSVVDGDQTTYNIQGQKKLVDANAEYLSANQMVAYDYTMYDGWYTADDDAKADYYQQNFSPELKDSLAADATDPFSEAYYAAKYEKPEQMFDEADELFKSSEHLNERSDALQLILLISALGLALAAWSSLLKSDSLMRLIFAIVSIAVFIYSSFLYWNVPVVAT
jgi:hypothetical protein